MKYIPIYICEVCGNPYGRPEEAAACESSVLPTRPKVRAGDDVLLDASGAHRCPTFVRVRVEEVVVVPRFRNTVVQDLLVPSALPLTQLPPLPQDDGQGGKYHKHMWAVRVDKKVHLSEYWVETSTGSYRRDVISVDYILDPADIDETWREL